MIKKLGSRNPCLRHQQRRWRGQVLCYVHFGILPRDTQIFYLRLLWVLLMCDHTNGELETLRPLRNCAGLSYYDITSAQSHVTTRKTCTMSQRSQRLS